MSAIPTSPQWSARVDSAQLSDGQKLLHDDVTALNNKIQEFVQTSIFQDACKSLLAASTGEQKVQLIFENGVIKLKHNEKETTLKTDTTAPTQKAVQETTTLVSEMARYYLSRKPTQTANPSSLSNLGNATETIKQADAATLKQYGIHGIENDTKQSCFANSAYQLCANIPSLKALVDDSTPLAYTNLTNSSDLIKKLNELPSNTGKPGKPTPRFEKAGAGDSSEVFQVLLDQKDVQYTKFSLDSGSTQESIFRCKIPLSNPTFDNIIQSTLSSADKSTSKKQFASAPNQLLIQVERKATPTEHNTATTFNDQFIEGIPMLLNLSEHVAKNSDSKDASTTNSTASLELKGFTVHKGADNGSGHYIAYFKKEDPINIGTYQWFCANDATILTVPEGEVLNALGHAYNLYYDNTTTDAKIDAKSKAPTQSPVLSYTKYLANNPRPNSLVPLSIPESKPTTNHATPKVDHNYTLPARASNETIEDYAAKELENVKDACAASLALQKSKIPKDVSTELSKKTSALDFYKLETDPITYFLGNFYLTEKSITIDKISFKCAEAAYQYLKVIEEYTLTDAEKGAILSLFQEADGQRAWELTNKHRDTESFLNGLAKKNPKPQVNTQAIMQKVLTAKFASGTAEAKLLTATKANTLVETTDHGDLYWGITRTGKNKQHQDIHYTERDPNDHSKSIKKTAQANEGTNMLGQLLMQQRATLNGTLSTSLDRAKKLWPR
ncbi:MAG: NADAR domain-containing protein [Chlamydiota bacterium]